MLKKEKSENSLTNEVIPNIILHIHPQKITKWNCITSGGARKNIGGGPAKHTLIYKYKFFFCNKR
jgi:hypothetical protein